MISRDLVHALDPVAFMTDAGFRPDLWQEGVLRSTARRQILLTSRQIGKSTVTAAIASHAAIYEPGALILLIAPSQSQSRELYRKVAGFLREASDTDPEAESAMRLELQNGSRIISLSGNPTTARGFSGPRLVVLDEAAWVSDELFHSITPMLSSGGRLIALSTPFGRRGWLHSAWAGNDPVWDRVRITADQSPRITPEFLAAERAAKPEWRIRQEYFCEFVDTDETLFGSEMVARALTPAVAPLFAQPFAW